MSNHDSLAALRRFLILTPTPERRQATFDRLLTFTFVATSAEDNVKATLAFEQAVAEGLDDQLISTARLCWRGPVCVLIALDTRSALEIVRHLRRLKMALRDLKDGTRWTILGSTHFLCVIEISQTDEPAPAVAQAHRLLPTAKVYTGALALKSTEFKTVSSDYRLNGA